LKLGTYAGIDAHAHWIFTLSIGWIILKHERGAHAEPGTGWRGGKPTALAESQ
jgi:hypothetical protein